MMQKFVTGSGGRASVWLWRRSVRGRGCFVIWISDLNREGGVSFEGGGGSARMEDGEFMFFAPVRHHRSHMFTPPPSSSCPPDSSQSTTEIPLFDVGPAEMAGDSAECMTTTINGELGSLLL